MNWKDCYQLGMSEERIFKYQVDVKMKKIYILLVLPVFYTTWMQVEKDMQANEHQKVSALGILSRGAV